MDGIAATIEEVLADADGRQVEVFGTGTVTLDVDGAAVTDVPMNPVLSFLHLLSDPNVAFILLVAGALLLATELVSTNLVTGILGALALVLAFIGFGSLPLNVAGGAAGGLRVRPVRPGVADRQPRAPDRGRTRVRRARRLRAVRRPGVTQRPGGPGRAGRPRHDGLYAGSPHGPDHHRRHPDTAHAGPCRPAGRPCLPGHRGRGPGTARPDRHGAPGRGDVDGPDAGRERPAARDSCPPRRLRRADRAGGAHRAAVGPTGHPHLTRVPSRRSRPPTSPEHWRTTWNSSPPSSPWASSSSWCS